MDERVYLALLFDTYGELLNERQKEVMRMRLLYDYSLSEIGEEFEISRQAVHDAEKKSVDVLKYYEKQLSVVKKREKLKEALSFLMETTAELNDGTEAKKKLIDKLKEMEEEIG